MCSYTSSATTMMPVSRVSAASAFRSASVHTVPVGLWGVLIMIIRVRGDNSARTACQSGR